MARRTPANLPIVPFSIFALLILAVLPTSLTGWVRELRGPFIAIITPVAAPLSALSTWLRESDRPVEDAPRATREALLDRADTFERLWLDSLRENDRLRGLVRDLQSGVAHPPRIPIDELAADRIGRDVRGGTIDLNRGSRHGIRPDAVVRGRGDGRQQLIGVVTAVSGLTCTVRLITDERIDPPRVVGAVLPPDPGAWDSLVEAPRCQLKPTGSGLLVDESFGIDPTRPVAVNDEVWLDDESWPAASSFLLLGRVSAIEPTDDPLFRRLFVKPVVEVGRQASVFIRVPKPGVGE